MYGSGICTLPELREANCGYFPGVFPQKNWVGVCGPLSKILPLFMNVAACTQVP